MILASISFGSLIVLIWVFIFFLGPIIKAVKANNDKKRNSETYIPQNTPPVEQKQTSVYRRTAPKSVDKSRQVIQSIPKENSLRSLLEKIDGDYLESEEVFVETPPSLPKEGSPQVKRATKTAQKLEQLKVDHSNNLEHEGIKSNYSIKSTKELKKAFVWSEILTRKYN